MEAWRPGVCVCVYECVRGVQKTKNVKTALAQKLIPFLYSIELQGSVQTRKIYIGNSEKYKGKNQESGYFIVWP